MGDDVKSKCVGWGWKLLCSPFSLGLRGWAGEGAPGFAESWCDLEQETFAGSLSSERERDGFKAPLASRAGFEPGYL